MTVKAVSFEDRSNVRFERQLGLRRDGKTLRDQAQTKHQQAAGGEHASGPISSEEAGAWFYWQARLCGNVCGACELRRAVNRVVTNREVIATPFLDPDQSLV